MKEGGDRRGPNIIPFPQSRQQNERVRSDEELKLTKRIQEVITGLTIAHNGAGVEHPNLTESERDALTAVRDEMDTHLAQIEREGIRAEALDEIKARLNTIRFALSKYLSDEQLVETFGSDIV